MCWGIFTNKGKLIFYDIKKENVDSVNEKTQYEVRELTRRELTDEIQKTKMGEYRKLGD